MVDVFVRRLGVACKAHECSISGMATLCAAPGNGCRAGVPKIAIPCGLAGTGSVRFLTCRGRAVPRRLPVAVRGNAARSCPWSLFLIEFAVSP